MSLARKAKTSQSPFKQMVTHDELNTPVHTFSHRIARYLEKRGILERDAHNTGLTLGEGEDDALTQLHGASMTYRIATKRATATGSPSVRTCSISSVRLLF